MKLYLIHTGYYDKDFGEGFYEQHSNIIIVADSVQAAKEKVRSNTEYVDKKMHIDGIKEIENIDGYKIKLHKTNEKEKITNFNHHQVRFLKSNKNK